MEIRIHLKAEAVQCAHSIHRELRTQRREMRDGAVSTQRREMRDGVREGVWEFWTKCEGLRGSGYLG